MPFRRAATKSPGATEPPTRERVRARRFLLAVTVMMMMTVTRALQVLSAVTRTRLAPTAWMNMPRTSLSRTACKQLRRPANFTLGLSSLNLPSRLAGLSASCWTPCPTKACAKTRSARTKRTALETSSATRFGLPFTPRKQVCSGLLWPLQQPHGLPAFGVALVRSQCRAKHAHVQKMYSVRV